MIWLILLILLAVPEWALAQSVNIRNGDAPGIAGVLNAAPVGTEYGLLVRVVSCLGCSGAASGLTDAQLRASPVVISGTFWQATQPVSGTFWQATQPVSIASMPSTPVTGTFWQATQPVSGTFWQATQPVSIASMPSTPVTGTFWQVTQPVSGTFWQATQPVSGTFWQATQPVSGAFYQAIQPVSIPDTLPGIGTPQDAPATTLGPATVIALLKALNLEITALQKGVTVSNLPASQTVSGAVAVNNFPATVQLANPSGFVLPPCNPVRRTQCQNQGHSLSVSGF